MGGTDRGWPLARGLCPRRQPRRAAAARPAWLRLLRDAPSVHTRRGPCRASPFLPRCRHHALPFSPAPTGKLAVHYIRNVNAGAPGHPAPGGRGVTAAAVASLRLRASGSEGGFSGKYRPSLPNPPPSPGPPPFPPCSLPRPAGCLQALRAGGGESCRSPGCVGRDALRVRVPAALQWQLPSRRLLTPALQCSRS